MPPDPSPELRAACASDGSRYRTRAVQAAADAYDRRRHLARIVPVSAREIADTSHNGTARIVETLEAAARNLNEAGRRKHWSYDANRHIAVLGAARAERATLAELEAETARCAETGMRFSSAAPEQNKPAAGKPAAGLVAVNPKLASSDKR